MLFLLSRGQALPRDITFAGCAAITRNAWVALSKYLRFSEDLALDGTSFLLKRVIKELPKAGAAATCGVRSLQGLSRRPITDDFPTLATATATLLKFAAESPSKLDTRTASMHLSGEILGHYLR